MGNCCKKRLQQINNDTSSKDISSENKIFHNDIDKNKKKGKNIILNKNKNKNFGKNENIKNNCNEQGNNYNKIFVVNNSSDQSSLYKIDEKSNSSDIISSSSSNEEILIGLENIGATCYMNATIQCLFNTKKLTKYFLTKYNNNDSSKIISNEFYILLKNLWDEKNYRNIPYSPKRFKDIISQENSLFEGVQANDSRDLINFLLERMHQELNEINENFNFNDMNNNNNILSNSNIQLDKEKIFQIFGNNYAKNYNSIISNLFYGINETAYQCQLCKRIKYNYEIYFLLEFPLEQVNIFCGRVQNNSLIYNQFNQFNQFNQNINMNNPDINLNDCFEYYRKTDLMTGENAMYCNFCQINCNSFYSTSLYTLPNYLILILNRGKGNSYKCKVNFPEILDLSHYVIRKESGYMYDLYGVICHLGPSSMGGHFIAFCRHRINNNWYKYNDAEVTKCENKDFLSGIPYILFYQQINVL